MDLPQKHTTYKFKTDADFADDDWSNTFDELLHSEHSLRLFCLFQPLELHYELSEWVVFLVVVLYDLTTSLHCTGQKFLRISRQHFLLLCWRSNSLIVKEMHLFSLFVQFACFDVLLFKFLNCCVQGYHRVLIFHSH